MKKKKFYSFRKILKKILNILSWVIIVTLFIIGTFLVYYVFNAKLHEKRGEEYIPPFALYTIISPSMEPNIKVYDVVLTKKITKPEDVKVGDVITFVSSAQISNDLTVTHRVSSINEVNSEKRYTTKGDNNVKDDEAYTLFGNIMGKVIIKLPQLGRVQFLLASKGGWFIIVMLPAMGIIIYDLLKLFKLFDLKDEVITIAKKEKEQDENDKYIKEQLRKQEIKNRMQIEDDNKQINKDIENTMPIFDKSNLDDEDDKIN